MSVGKARDDLSEFLRQHKESLGVSYRELAVRAVDPVTGQTLGFQWFDRLAKNQIAKAPDPAQLRALAAALGADEQMIKALAARQWLEYEYEAQQLSLGTPWDWALYPQVRGLAEADQETLRQLVSAFIRSRPQQEEEDGGASELGTAHG